MRHRLACRPNAVTADYFRCGECGEWYPIESLEHECPGPKCVCGGAFIGPQGGIRLDLVCPRCDVQWRR